MTDHDDTHRRLTPTERLHEVTMAVITRPHAAPEHAVDIARNAKGQTQFSVTVRGHDLGQVEDSARATYDRLNTRYPHPDALPPVENGDERA